MSILATTEFRVYQLVSPEAMDFIQPTSKKWLTNRDDFRLVMICDTFTLDDVFGIGNGELGTITWHSRIPFRSTSIGDIIVSDLTGQAFLVTSGGFMDVNECVNNWRKLLESDI